MATPPLKEVIVLGAGEGVHLRITVKMQTERGYSGVIGLTTALRIQEKGGYHVTVVGEVMHGDPQSVKYTSYWAVCA